ncbi:MAG: glycosyltransferase [Desulfobulbus sp.]|nr:glycosyltransferase [Desulfobulbus sp.]
MRVVWLIQNMVPYHHVKFEAFAASFDGAVHVAQVTGMDSFKVLEFHPESMSYTLDTLFEDINYSRIPVAQLFKSISNFIQCLKPDCLCVSGWGLTEGQIALLVGFEQRIPIVLCSDSNEFDEPRRWHKEWVKRQIVSHCASWLVAGTSAADYIQKLGGGMCVTGYDVVDNAHFEVVMERPVDLPEMLEQSAWFFACARFGRKKNLFRLLEAYAGYRQRCQKAQVVPHLLVIAGDGELRPEIEALIERRGLRGPAVLLGAVSYDSMPWLYQNCLAFVHVSTTEQWGLVVNEAMAAGAPILLSNRCGCASDLLQDGENGFLLDPFDIKSISESLWKFHQLPVERQESFRNQSRKIIAGWGPSRFSEAFQEAIAKAVAAGAARHTFVARQLLRLLLAQKGSKNV